MKSEMEKTYLVQFNEKEIKAFKKALDLLELYNNLPEKSVYAFTVRMASKLRSIERRILIKLGSLKRVGQSINILEDIKIDNLK